MSQWGVLFGGVTEGTCVAKEEVGYGGDGVVSVTGSAARGWVVDKSELVRKRKNSSQELASEVTKGDE